MTTGKSLISSLRRLPKLARRGPCQKRPSETTGVEAKTSHRLLEVNLGTRSLTRTEALTLECDLLVGTFLGNLWLAAANSAGSEVP